MLSFHYVSIKKIAILYPTFIFQFDSIKNTIKDMILIRAV